MRTMLSFELKEISCIPGVTQSGSARQQWSDISDDDDIPNSQAFRNSEESAKKAKVSFFLLCWPHL